MKIWIIKTECACGWYSGEEIAGAYTTEEKAEEALKEFDGEFYYISELEVK